MWSCKMYVTNGIWGWELMHRRPHWNIAFIPFHSICS